jgi:hypothetical protein
MSKQGPIFNDLDIGDLVNHVLYGRAWVGVILEFTEEIIGLNDRRKTKALVQIQPGTEHEGFFRRASSADRINENLGYVSVHWLFKVKVENGYTRSTRSSSPPSGRGD